MSIDVPEPARASTGRAALSVHLRLGRISNLPTVWSNVLAAAIATGLTPQLDLNLTSLMVVMAAASAMYIGGMYLNDACDAEIDARERSERPIPAGLISRQSVYRYSAIWLTLGVAGFVTARHVTVGLVPDGTSAWMTLLWILSPLALIACIVAYNQHHKGNPYGPLLMAGCRAFLYLSVGLTLAARPSVLLLLAAALAFSWIIGLTAFAKRESSPNKVQALGRADWPLLVLAAPLVIVLGFVGANALAVLLSVIGIGIIARARQLMRDDIPANFGKAIGLLISGVSIVDALIIAGTGAIALAIVAALCCPMTLVLQRWVSGT